MHRFLLPILLGLSIGLVAAVGGQPAFGEQAAVESAGSSVTGKSIAGGEKPVDAGRDALDQWGRYPWYDTDNDTIKRIDVEPPRIGFWEWLADLFNISGGAGPSAGFMTGLQWIVFTLIAVAALVLIFFLARAFIRKDLSEAGAAALAAKKKKEEGRRRIEALPFPIARDQSNLLDAIRHYYERGEYGEAIKYLFSYQLVQLDKHNAIRLTRGKTNRQYLRELGFSHCLRPQVEETMITFEDFFFGHRAIQRPRFEACWSRLEFFDAQLTAQKNIGSRKT